MRIKNILIVVEDMERSKAFYREMFGMHTVTDFGENVILTEGLVLQERRRWEEDTGLSVEKGGNDAELYFETYDLDGFLVRVKESGDKPAYIIKPEYTAEPGQTADTGQAAVLGDVPETSGGLAGQAAGGRRIVRLYDPDGHIIEVAEVQTGGKQ